MHKGFLHALQYDAQNVDSMFAPYGPNDTGGPMKPRRFHGGEAAVRSGIPNRARIHISFSTASHSFGRAHAKRSTCSADIQRLAEQVHRRMSSWN